MVNDKMQKEKIKVDPKAPHTHPDWKLAVKKGKEQLANMKFESEGQRKDYMKMVKSNPNNVPGLPVFYPPMRTMIVVSKSKSNEYNNKKPLCSSCDSNDTYFGYSQFKNHILQYSVWFCCKCNERIEITERISNEH